MTPIEELGLGPRITNALQRHEVFTIEELEMLSSNDVSKMRNIGTATLDQIELVLAGRGLRLSGVTTYRGVRPALFRLADSIERQGQDLRDLIRALDRHIIDDAR